MTMIHRYLLLLGVLAVGAMLIVSSIDAKDAQAPDDDPAARIVSLLKERRDTFRQLATVVEQAYRQGEGTFASVIQASNSLLEVELDLATDKAERITLHEKRVANVKQMEQITMALHRNREATRVDVLAAKGARLKAEIELLREQASDK